MVDLNKLDPAALSAAMRGGTDSWGEWSSSTEHVRYAQSVQTRRRCRCGCKTRVTYLGMANGISLTEGCELTMNRWVLTGHFRAARNAMGEPKE